MRALYLSALSPKLAMFLGGLSAKTVVLSCCCT